jgi:hypothetical protein
MVTRGSFPGGIARSGRNADHSPPSSAEMSRSLPSSPPQAPLWIVVGQLYLLAGVAQSVLCLTTDWMTGRPVFDHRQRIFPLTSVSRPALGPTQPPVQWVPGVLSLGVKSGWCVTLTTYPQTVPTLRMSRSYASSSLVAYIAVEGQIYFTCLTISFTVDEISY